MNLKQVGSNQTELKMNDYIVLVSYQTPVAIQDRKTGAFYQTEKKWSKTTSRHIGQWLRSYGDPGAQYKPQSFFDAIVEVA